jgi:hypothetical protein
MPKNDPLNFDANPDPAFHFDADADPEPASQNDAYSCGSGCGFMRIPMRIRIRNNTIYIQQNQ